jgi:hypothetical protein
LLFPCLLVAGREFLIKKVLPEVGRIDAAVLDMGQGGFDRVDVVDGKQAGNAHLPGHGRDEARHPVVAVDQVRLHPGNDVVDHLTLKGQGELGIFTAVGRVDAVQVEKSPVLGQMNPVIGHDVADGPLLPFEKRCQAAVENGPVVRQGHVYVGALVEQGADQGGRHIGQPAGLGREVSGEIAHSIGQVGHFRGNDQHPGISFARRHRRLLLFCVQRRSGFRVPFLSTLRIRQQAVNETKSNAVNCES